MNNTVFEFWKMISEQNCQIVVCLNQEYLKEVSQSLYFPLDNETKTIELEDLKFSILFFESSAAKEGELDLKSRLTKDFI